MADKWTIGLQWNSPETASQRVHTMKYIRHKQSKPRTEKQGIKGKRDLCAIRDISGWGMCSNSPNSKEEGKSTSVSTCLGTCLLY